MAKLDIVLPDDVLKDIQYISENSEKIFGEMTKAGAKVAYDNITRTVPKAIKQSSMMNNLKMSKVYKTPSDDGINTKVLFAGYFTNENGVKTPAPLVANMFEYGTTKRKWKKHPFLRASFMNGNIERAMLKAQEEYSKGLLKDE